MPRTKEKDAEYMKGYWQRPEVKARAAARARARRAAAPRPPPKPSPGDLVLGALRSGPSWATLAFLTHATGLSPTTLRKALASLEGAGRVMHRAVADGPGRPATTYHLRIFGCPPLTKP